MTDQHDNLLSMPKLPDELPTLADTASSEPTERPTLSIVDSIPKRGAVYRTETFFIEGWPQCLSKDFGEGTANALTRSTNIDDPTDTKWNVQVNIPTGRTLEGTMPNGQKVQQPEIAQTNWNQTIEGESLDGIVDPHEVVAMLDESVLTAMKKIRDQVDQKIVIARDAKNLPRAERRKHKKW